VLSASPTLTGTIDAAAQTLSGNLTLNGGTANGVLYLNGSKVATSGTALVFDGTNLGIGTSSPATRIHAERSTDGVIGTFRGTSTAQYLVGIASGVVTHDASNGSATHTWQTNGTERMRLDSSGNLGLGLTPRAWAGGYKSFDITGPGAIASTASGDTFTQVANGAWFNGTNWIYQYTGIGAARYQMTGPSGGGNHSWYVAASGTAGNTISFTQAMTLDANGNFVLGTTSALSSSYRITSYGGRVNFAGNNDALNLYLQYSNGTAGVFIGSPAANVLAFSDSNGTERARITAGGNLLVGTTSDNGYHRFVKSNTSDWICTFANSSATTPWGISVGYSAAAPNNTNSGISLSDTGGERATIRNNGGLANYSANNVNLSDERTKKNIVPLGSMWNKFKAIEIVKFKYRDQTHDDDNIGVIAQQVESVAPEFVDIDGFGETPEDGVPFKTVYTTDMYHAAIKALQEAMARIEQLEAKFAALESK
jgi:hypothetical protein